MSENIVIEDDANFPYRVDVNMESQGIGQQGFEESLSHRSSVSSHAHKEEKKKNPQGT